MAIILSSAILITTITTIAIAYHITYSLIIDLDNQDSISIPVNIPVNILINISRNLLVLVMMPLGLITSIVGTIAIFGLLIVSVVTIFL